MTAARALCVDARGRRRTRGHTVIAWRRPSLICRVSLATPATQHPYNEVAAAILAALSPRRSRRPHARSSTSFSAHSQFRTTNLPSLPRPPPAQLLPARRLLLPSASLPLPLLLLPRRRGRGQPPLLPRRPRRRLAPLFPWRWRGRVPLPPAGRRLPFLWGTGRLPPASPSSSSGRLRAWWRVRPWAAAGLWRRLWPRRPRWVRRWRRGRVWTG